MTSQARKHRGYRTQKVLADWLRERGFLHAEPTGAGRSGTDILGIPGLDIEVKARAGLDLPALMRQLKERAAEGVLGVGVLRLNGQGESSIGEWVMVMRVEDGARLLREVGYGT